MLPDEVELVAVTKLADQNIQIQAQLEIPNQFGIAEAKLQQEGEGEKSETGEKGETTDVDQMDKLEVFDVETARFQKNYAFLFLGYQQSCYYWEVCVYTSGLRSSMCFLDG